MPQEVFFKNHLRTDHDTLLFNNITVHWTLIQKHIVLLLDKKFSFQNHIKEKLKTLVMNKSYFKT